MEKGKLRVIGWATSDVFHFLPVEKGDVYEGEYLDALVKEIQEHGYCFSGADYQDRNGCAPVFSNYRVGVYSRRGFAYVMALAHGFTDEYDYALYSDCLRLEESVPSYPNESINGRDDDAFEIKEIDAKRQDFFLKGFVNEVHYYLYPSPLEVRYWICDAFDFRGPEYDFLCDTMQIFSFESYEEFVTTFPDIQERCYDTPFFYDEEEIKAFAARGPFLLLALRKQGHFRRSENVAPDYDGVEYHYLGSLYAYDQKAAKLYFFYLDKWHHYDKKVPFVLASKRLSKEELLSHKGKELTPDTIAEEK